MPRTYERAPREVKDRAAAIVRAHHDDLENAGVTFDFLYARNDGDGPALTCGGYPALAVCRIVSLKDRAKKNADAEITVDADHYENMTDAQKDGLLDHELNHLIVARDDEGGFKTDDLHRPKLKMRKHDYQFGWFTEIARRHGMDSPEVYQAQILWQNDGQSYFPALTGDDASPVPPAKRAAKLKVFKPAGRVTINGEDGKTIFDSEGGHGDGN